MASMYIFRLVLVLQLSAAVLGQDVSSDLASSISSASAVASSAASLSVTASDASSSASAALSSASSLASASDTAAASSASSIASSLSSVASSASSVASSLASVASSVSSVVSSASSASLSSTILSTTSSSPTPSRSATSESSTSDTRSTASSSLASSSESLVTSRTATSSSETVLSTTSSSISFASSTVQSTSVIPTTSADGAVGFSTVTSFVVESSPASTYTDISPYTTSNVPASDNTATTQPGSSTGGGGGLSTGAKAGIGAGVGVAVLGAAIFGGWYAWYMRKRRRRNSISASDRYPPSSIPSMQGMGGYGAVGGAVGAGHMTEKSERSELPSPPIGSHSPRQDWLAPPVAGGISSMDSTSHPHSNRSTSDYSGNDGRAPGSDHGEPGPGYFPPAAGPAVHEMGENDRNQPNTSPPQGHHRTLSGDSISQPSEIGGTATGHHRTVSNGSQPYQSPQNQEGYWQSTQQQPSELQGSPGHQQAPVLGSSPPRQGYRGVDPEVPLHQRISGGQDRPPPFRAGHLQKQQPGGAGYGPSQNF